MVQVNINGEVRGIEADQMKLARTMWNKPGDKYTEEEMSTMGFVKKFANQVNGNKVEEEQ